MNPASSTGSSSFLPLKRTLPEESLDPFPRLPKITSDLILQVYTHISLRKTNEHPENYGDNERLAQLGKSVLDATVTCALFNKRPLLKTADIRLQRDQAISAENVEKWVTEYNMRQKLRCHPNVFPALGDPEEARTLFYAYMGGVYTEHGIETVQEWVNQLLSYQNHYIISSPSAPPEPIAPAPKRMKSEQPASYRSSTIFFASQPPPSPPPPPKARPNPLAPAQPNLPFLPLFNQTALQRRVTVEYPAEFSGPPHAGRWSVRCIVNGIQKGLGTGSSKQTAKEEAARQAYYAMGWT